MTSSKNSSLTSSEQFFQLPLKGFKIPLKSDKPGWNKSVEGMGGERYRIHLSKIKK